MELAGKAARKRAYLGLSGVGLLAAAAFLVRHAGRTWSARDWAAAAWGAVVCLVGLVLLAFERGKPYGRRGLFGHQIHLVPAVLFLFLISASTGLCSWMVTSRKIPVDPGGWRIGIYLSSGNRPEGFSGDATNNPVLTADDVTDIEARFVADPFLAEEDGKYYMFFEVLNGRTGHGDIALATSSDGFKWEYMQVVLDEPFHLSFPYVFKWKGAYFMVPETHQLKEIRLYRGSPFPFRWQLDTRLLQGEDFCDSILFQHDGTWWLFSSTGRSGDTLRLYYAEEMRGTWHEHPVSPVVRENADTARLAGPVLVSEEGIIRYAQDDAPYYGNQVWAFRIKRLTEREYAEELMDPRPVLKGSDNWNTRGMHQLAPLRLPDGRWIAAVDGF